MNTKKIVALVIAIALGTGCIVKDDDATGETPAAATTPPVVPGGEVTPGTAPAGETQTSTEGIEATPGAPKLTSVSWFGRPEGFPTYKAHYLGKLANLFPKIAVENPTDKPVKVELRGSLQGFSADEGVVTLDLAPGEKKEGGFNAALDFAKLNAVSAPVGATYSVKLLVDGKVVSAWSKPIQVLPKNSVFWTKSGETSFDKEEIAISIASLTTPHDAWQEVDKLLQEAASASETGAMLGYQYQRAGTTVDQHVAGAIDQVGAIYSTLADQGFNYTSVSADFFSGGQNVRYPAESLRVKTGNCIDASLVFASALEAIGMAPFIVVIPGHAFVGVHAGAKGTAAYDKILFVETTVVSSQPFDMALRIGLSNFQKTPADKRIVMDIESLRAAKLLPSPLPM